MAGTAVASAHLFGVDIHDLFHHKKKNKKSNPAAGLGPRRGGGVKNSGGALGPGAAIGAKPESKIGTSKIGTSSAVTSKVGVDEAPATAARGSFAETPRSARVGTTAQVPSAVLSGGISQTPTAAVTGDDRGGGAVGAPINGNIGRAPNLAPVPTAPSGRTIVIRSAPSEVPAAPAPAIGAALAPIVPAPVVVPPAIPAPAAPPARASSAAPSAPILPVPRSEPPVAQSLSAPTTPEFVRLGYTDYLRTASTTDLLFAVLPGLSGMLLMTAAGGAVGFRQARAAQTLPSPQIARFLP